MLIKKGRLTGALAAIALVGILIWSFLPEPISVEVEEIKEGSFQASFKEEGKTRLRNRYTISSPFIGTLLRSRLRSGDQVNQGEIIATLYAAPSPLLDPRAKSELQERIGVAQAIMEEEASLHESARFQLNEAQRETDRVRSLVSSGSAPRQQLERLELAENIARRNLVAAEMRHHAAEHSFAQAKTIVSTFGTHDHDEQFHITAPLSGTITKVYQQSEGIVSSGTSLFDLGDLQDLEIVADVLTRDIISIRPGQKVLIDDWGGAYQLEGRVRFAVPTAITKVSALGIEEQRSRLIIDLVSPVEMWSRLGDQYRVTIRVITNEIDRTLLSPSGALFHKDGSDYVFVAKENKAYLRKVEIGQRSNNSVVVLSGLTVGDEVIIYPPGELSDGAKISIR